MHHDRRPTEGSRIPKPRPSSEKGLLLTALGAAKPSSEKGENAKSGGALATGADGIGGCGRG